MQEGLAFTPQLAAISRLRRCLWLIPAVPIVASGVIALLKQPRRKLASALAIGSLGFSLLLSLVAFAHVLRGWSHGYAVREIVNFTWFQVGTAHVELGWVLDPLAAVMLVMVSSSACSSSSTPPATWRTTKTSRASSASSRCLPGRCWAW